MKLKLIRTENYAEMSLEAGKIIVEKIRSNPAYYARIGHRKHPKGVYDYLIHDHEQTVPPLDR